MALSSPLVRFGHLPEIQKEELEEMKIKPVSRHKPEEEKKKVIQREESENPKHKH